MDRTLDSVLAGWLEGWRWLAFVSLCIPGERMSLAFFS